MISISAAVHVILLIIVAGLVFWLLWWLIGYVGLPEPFNKVARVILAVLAVFVLIGPFCPWLVAIPCFARSDCAGGAVGRLGGRCSCLMSASCWHCSF